MKTHASALFNAIILLLAINVYGEEPKNAVDNPATPTIAEQDSLEHFDEGDLDATYGYDDDDDSYELTEDYENNAPQGSDCDGNYCSIDTRNTTSLLELEDDNEEDDMSLLELDDMEEQGADGEMLDEDDFDMSLLELDDMEEQGADGEMLNEDDFDMSLLELDDMEEQGADGEMLNEDDFDMSLLELDDMEEQGADGEMLNEDDEHFEDVYDNHIMLQLNGDAHEDDEANDKSYDRKEELYNLMANPVPEEGMEDILDVINPDDVTYQPIRAHQQNASYSAPDDTDVLVDDTPHVKEFNIMEAEIPNKKGFWKGLTPRVKRIIIIVMVCIGILIIVLCIVGYAPNFLRKFKESVAERYRVMTGRSDELPHQENAPLLNA